MMLLYSFHGCWKTKFLLARLIFLASRASATGIFFQRYTYYWVLFSTTTTILFMNYLNFHQTSYVLYELLIYQNKLLKNPYYVKFWESINESILEWLMFYAITMYLPLKQSKLIEYTFK